MKDLFSLEGRTAWVIGGAGHLGAASARALAQRGARVVLSGRNSDGLTSLEAQLRAEGLEAHAAMLDVADEVSVRDTANTLVAQYGRLDVCVNLSYRASGAPHDEVTVTDWEEGLRISAIGAFVVGREAGRVMSRGGSIIQFASMYGMVAPDPRNYPMGISVNPPDYGFAKAGVLQLVRYQAVHFAQRGVRVNAITPGPFPGTAARESPEFIARLSDRVPLGRVGNADEIGGAVVFLASEASSFVTGSNIVVDGGWTAW